jgi:uncharacterized protein YdhG (YjbR/CyaY superfamily)
MDKSQAVDVYIQSFPEAVQARLNSIRQAIRSLVPEATEAMTYGIPTFKFHGNLVHYAAFEHHIGFYPTPSGIAAFRKEISRYKNAKGSVQFPHNEELPLELILSITRFRVSEQLSNA